MSYEANGKKYIGNEWNEDFVESGAPSSHTPGGWYGEDPREINARISAMVHDHSREYNAAVLALLELNLV